jgi:hypothetical protein
MPSLVLTHDAPELKLTHFIEQFNTATHDILHATQSLAIDAHMSIEQIAEHFGIHHFGIHIVAKSLSDCKIILTSDSHLEIHRIGQEQPTRFKVARKDVTLA